VYCKDILYSISGHITIEMSVVDGVPSFAASGPLMVLPRNGINEINTFTLLVP
jgi:hypothetical protein